MTQEMLDFDLGEGVSLRLLFNDGFLDGGCSIKFMGTQSREAQALFHRICEAIKSRVLHTDEDYLFSAHSPTEDNGLTAEIHISNTIGAGVRVPPEGWDNNQLFQTIKTVIPELKEKIARIGLSEVVKINPVQRTLKQIADIHFPKEPPGNPWKRI